MKMSLRATWKKHLRQVRTYWDTVFERLVAGCEEAAAALSAGLDLPALAMRSIVWERTPYPRARSRPFRPILEFLETRQMLSVFTVNTTDDTVVLNPADGTGKDANGNISLRSALQEANYLGVPATVDFSIGSGVQTIVASGLPKVTVSITIDGTTQPGFSSMDPKPIIDLDGALNLRADGSIVRGLAIRFGVSLVSNSNLLAGNFIGTDVTGTAIPFGGTSDCVLVSGSNNTIGGTTAADRNILSGNEIDADIAGTTAAVRIVTGSGNLVEGNYIGTDVTGIKALGNVQGVVVNGSNNTIGGTTAAARNIITASGFDGVALRGGSGHLVEGNYIGTDVTGTMALSQYGDGVYIYGADNCTIGGTTAAARNIISGNGDTGVRILGGSGHVVEGNYIGTDVTGTMALANGTNFVGTLPPADGDGVLIYGGAFNCLIGGTAAGTGNVISGNTINGIHIAGGTTHDIGVQHNYIGLDATGTVALANLGDGVLINDAPGNTIGGNNNEGVDKVTNVDTVTLIAGNVISGNSKEGVAITGVTATGNLVQGNFIGTDAKGVAKKPNGANGVRIDGAPANILGQDPKNKEILHYRNLISGNGANGVYITGDTADGNRISANFIGTLFGGETPLGNVNDGVRIDGAPNTVLNGSIGSNGGLVISGNGLNGVEIIFAPGTSVSYSEIGTDFHATISLANGIDGVRIDNGSGSTIKKNVISGNTVQGVHIFGAATGNSVVENNIGFLQTTVPNGQDGVLLEEGASHNVIGGNVISGNLLNGVEISGFLTNGNLVQGNRIGTDGLKPFANLNDGVRIGGGASFNTIGAALAGQPGNLIAGNDQNGVEIAGSDQNLVAANQIGNIKTIEGVVSLPNGNDGVLITGGASQNIIGQLGAGLENVISGNTTNGVEVTGAGTNRNIVQHNFIGTNADGADNLGNGKDGVLMSGGAANNLIGGLGVGAGNIISGNSKKNGNGVEIVGANTNGNVVLNNRIGLDGNGNVLANGNDGVRIGGGAANNIIGQPGAGLGNTISGNTAHGVEITDAGTNGNIVQNNFIGTNAAGADGLGNGKDGVLIIGGAANNTIGGVVVGAGNIISNNGANGVEITGAGTTRNLVQNNFIGTDSRGMQGNIPLRNRKDGVLLSGGAANNTIGGAGVGGPNGGLFNGMLSNLISDNGANGVEITGAGTNGNVVLQNVIGTDVNGINPLGNGALGGGDGVLISGGASKNTIGGPLPPAGAFPGFANLISGNFGNGIRILDAATTGNFVFDNFIGTNGAGLGPVPNASDGVLISNAPNNFIGVPLAPANIISGNTGNGVEIKGAAATGNLVEFNYIGVAFNLAPLGNKGCGVYVNGASGNGIGSKNAIAFNGTLGAVPPTGGVVVVDDPTLPPGNATGNLITANSIYLNNGLGIDLGDDGVTLNDSKGHVGPNHFQNFPVLTAGYCDGTTTVIRGYLDSNPTPHRVEFFSNTVKDPSGYGQGQTYLGAVMTDAKGHAGFTFTFQGDTRGLYITATATDVTGTPPRDDTSEFSGVIQAIMPPLDFGHAPAPYPTLLRDNGARHIVSDLYLGRSVDADPDGEPSPLRNPDLDDDGVTFLTPLIPGQRATVDVFASGAGYLDAWIDFNHDGSWKDVGDQIFTSKAVVGGPNLLSFDVPTSAQPTNLTFSRFRLSSTGGLSYVGLAIDGEVEDYGVTIFGHRGGGGNALAQPGRAVYPAFAVPLGTMTASITSASNHLSGGDHGLAPRDAELFFSTLGQDMPTERRALDVPSTESSDRSFGQDPGWIRFDSIRWITERDRLWIERRFLVGGGS